MPMVSFRNKNQDKELWLLPLNTEFRKVRQEDLELQTIQDYTNETQTCMHIYIYACMHANIYAYI